MILLPVILLLVLNFLDTDQFPQISPWWGFNQLQHLLWSSFMFTCTKLIIQGVVQQCSYSVVDLSWDEVLTWISHIGRRCRVLCFITSDHWPELWSRPTAPHLFMFSISVFYFHPTSDVTLRSFMLSDNKRDSGQTRNSMLMTITIQHIVVIIKLSLVPMLVEMSMLYDYFREHSSTSTSYHCYWSRCWYQY